MRGTGRTAGLLLLLGLAPAVARSEVLRVPADHPTIKSAVERAADGDTVLVDDGVYLEKNIVVARKIRVGSKNPFGAVIYGSPNVGDAIFVVRAAARIEGFVLRNSQTGIEQRGGPDVRWEAADLAILDCMTGISINDAEGNVGSAAIERVIVLGFPAATGICTNDAGRVEASGCLIMDCRAAFQGYDHLSFGVRDSLVVDCAEAFDESTSHRPVPPATSRIDRGHGVSVLGPGSRSDPRRREQVGAFIRLVVIPSLDEVMGEADDGGTG